MTNKGLTSIEMVTQKDVEEKQNENKKFVVEFNGDSNFVNKTIERKIMQNKISSGGIELDKQSPNIN